MDVFQSMNVYVKVVEAGSMTAYLAERFGEGVADDLTRGNPLRILRGEVL